MEPWTYPSEGRGLWFSDEIDLPMDACARSRKPLTEWGIRSPNNFENHGLVSNREAIESMEFVELGFPDMMRKSFHSNLNVGFLGGEIGSESRKRVASPTYLSTSKFSSGKEESGSILLCSPLMESNSHDSSLIDLKLGRLADSKDAHIDNILKEISVLSSVGSPLLEKRAPKMNSDSRTPFCQVQGCNKDLSSSKEYHKRHKVCDVHSKTPKVIVNGIEKRFCQQCSRFHLLVEFDDGKRSCRKRLAGHNKRRRKPQFDILSGKPHKLLQSCQDIHPGGVLYQGKYEHANQHVKLKEGSISFPQMAIPIADRQMLPKFLLPLHGVGKQYSSGIPSLGIEDYSVFDTASTVQDSPGVSSSSCALSLLSARSQDSPSHSAGIPMAHPLIIQGSRGNHHMGHIFDKPSGLSSLDKYTPNGFYSSGIYPKEVDKMGLMVSDTGHSSDFEAPRDETLQRANLLNTKHHLSPEYGATVDLLQLSSHLQRVERQRNSMQLKQENGDYICFQAT